jgi:hypothetical protein
VTDIDALIRHAIAQKRLLQFSFRGGVRIAEPHDYGVRNGNTQLLVFQTGGASRSGGLPDWRWIDVARVSEVAILEQTFSGRRPAPSGKHAQWDQVFVRVADGG